MPGGRVFVTGAEADPQAKYRFVLSLIVLLACASLVRGRLQRAWMAIRDMGPRRRDHRLSPAADKALEPNGLARLWAIGKEKRRLWPFPH